MIETHLGEFADEIVRIRFLGGFDHLLFANAVISITDVFADCCVKENRFLANDTDIRPKPLYVQL